MHTVSFPFKLPVSKKLAKCDECEKGVSRILYEMSVKKGSVKCHQSWVIANYLWINWKKGDRFEFLAQMQ